MSKWRSGTDPETVSNVSAAPTTVNTGATGTGAADVDGPRVRHRNRFDRGDYRRVGCKRSNSVPAHVVNHILRNGNNSGSMDASNKGSSRTILTSGSSTLEDSHSLRAQRLRSPTKMMGSGGVRAKGKGTPGPSSGGVGNGASLNVTKRGVSPSPPPLSRGRSIGPEARSSSGLSGRGRGIGRGGWFGASAGDRCDVDDEER